MKTIQIEFLRHKNPAVNKIGLYFEDGDQFTYFNCMDTPSRIDNAFQETSLLIDYINGRTPMRVNRYMEFKDLQEHLKKQGGSLKITNHKCRKYRYELGIPERGNA